MNDPLRDNRIFPEEMQQQPAVETKKSPTNIVWWFIVVVILAVIVLFFYNFYTETKEEIIRENAEQAEFQRQENNLKQVESANPGLNESQRQDKIKTFFEISE
jgi:flagellar biosynthesis/type III secretory pathway M-ring protein FliF/YscJ